MSQNGLPTQTLDKNGEIAKLIENFLNKYATNQNKVVYMSDLYGFKILAINKVDISLCELRQDTFQFTGNAELVIIDPSTSISVTAKCDINGIAHFEIYNNEPVEVILIEINYVKLPDIK